MISVFISSTFKDMQRERDILHREVFPALRRQLREEGEDIQELDLRLGVDTSNMSEERSSRYVISTCFDAIDQCRPYLLVLLGERYGWIPDQETIDRMNDSRAAAVFRDAVSITNAEILYGALRDTANWEHCIFCFRNPDFSGRIPAIYRGDYAAESPAHAAKLLSLKTEIRRLGGMILEYDAQWDSAADMRRIEDAFADGVQSMLLGMIRQELPENRVPVSPEGKILAGSELTRRRYLAHYTEANRFICYGKGTLWIYGETGCGKSAVLSQVLMLAEKQADVVPASGRGNDSSDGKAPLYPGFYELSKEYFSHGRALFSGIILHSADDLPSNRVVQEMFRDMAEDACSPKEALYHAAVRFRLFSENGEEAQMEAVAAQTAELLLRRPLRKGPGSGERRPLRRGPGSGSQRFLRRKRRTGRQCRRQGRLRARGAEAVSADPGRMEPSAGKACRAVELYRELAGSGSEEIRNRAAQQLARIREEMAGAAESGKPEEAGELETAVEPEKVGGSEEVEDAEKAGKPGEALPQTIDELYAKFLIPSRDEQVKKKARQLRGRYLAMRQVETTLLCGNREKDEETYRSRQRALAGYFLAGSIRMGLWPDPSDRRSGALRDGMIRLAMGAAPDTPLWSAGAVLVSKKWAEAPETVSGEERRYLAQAVSGKELHDIPAFADHTEYLPSAAQKTVALVDALGGGELEDCRKTAMRHLYAVLRLTGQEASLPGGTGAAEKAAGALLALTKEDGWEARLRSLRERNREIMTSAGELTEPAAGPGRGKADGA